MNLPQRKANRMYGYDYSLRGAYFVTICVKERAPILWEDCNGFQYSENYSLSEYGKTVNIEIERLNTIYNGIYVDKYCIMPDHIHLIIISNDIIGRSKIAPTLSRIIQQFKGVVSKKVGFSLWQKSFHDHIIRNEYDYSAICKYIEENPTKYFLSK